MAFNKDFSTYLLTQPEEEDFQVSYAGNEDGFTCSHCNTSYEKVCHVIKQGRCTLVTTLQMFKPHYREFSSQLVSCSYLDLRSIMTTKGYIIGTEGSKDKDYLAIKSAEVLIGNSREADYRLPISTEKQQCHIWRKGSKTFLRNLGDKEIFVNNDAVYKTVAVTLHDLDVIKIADNTFRYEVRGNSNPTAPPHKSNVYNWRNTGAMPIHRPFSPPGPIKKTKKKKRPSLNVNAARLKNKSNFAAAPRSSISNKKKTKKTSKKRKASTSDSDSGPEDVINNGEKDIAFRAIDRLKEVFKHLGPKLQSSLTQFHKTFVGNCLDRLHKHYNHYITIPEEVMIQNRSNTNSRVLKILKVLHKYITECDNMYSGERKLIPLHRACRGEHLLLSVRFNQPEGRTIEDVELPTHTHDTIDHFRIFGVQ